MNIEEKYKNLFERLENQDQEKYKNKCLLIKKGICRNLKLFLELSEENKKLNAKMKEIERIANIGIKEGCRGCEYKDFESTLETIKEVINEK